MHKTQQQKEKRTRSYVNEVFTLIQTKPDIEDIIILNNGGIPVKTTMEMKKAVELSGLYLSLFDKILFAMNQIDAFDEILMIRVRTKHNETFVTPDEKITVIVVQHANDQFQRNL